MLIFVYGTLLDPARLRRFTGRATPCETAFLDGYRRVRLRHATYPTLRKAFRESVTGGVIQVNADALRRLIAYEGPRYRLARVAVRRGWGKTAAFVWIAQAATARPWP